MKGLKILAIVVGSLAALLALAAILAFTPSVQTWAARKALAGQPGMEIQVGRVDAGLSAADLTDVRVVRDGAVITVKRVSASYSAWDYLTQKRIDADRVVAEGVLIDLTRSGVTSAPTRETAPRPSASLAPSARAPQPAPADFQGLLHAAELPFDIRIAQLAADGRALLPEGQTVAFDVRGQGIANGQRGTIEWRADFADSTVGAPLKAVRSSGMIAVQITTDRRISLLALDGTVAAEGPQLPADEIKLAARAEHPANAREENYHASVGLVRGNTVEPLLSADGRFDPAAREIVGAWKLSVRTQQLAALLTGLGLPEVAAEGGGNFRLNPNAAAVAADGNFDANVTRLENVSPELAAIGALQLRANFDGGFADNKARLERLQLHATGSNGQRFAEIETSQRVEFDTATQHVALTNPQAELARVALRALPLAWAQPFVPGLTLGGGDLSLQLAIEAQADGSRVRARAVEPLALRNVTISSGTTTLVDRLTLTARPAVDYSAAKVLAELAELQIALPAGDTLTGTASAEVTNLAATPAIAFAAQLNARVVAALKPYLPLDPGPLALAASLEGRMQGDTLRLAKLTSTVTRAEGAMLAAFELQQPVNANLAATTFTLERPQTPAARLRLGEVPLAWAQTFVPNSQFSGALVSATLEITAPAIDDISLKTIEPLVARQIAATIDGSALVQALDFSVDLTATKRGETIAYDVRRLELRQGDAALATLVAAGEATLGEKPQIVAKGQLDADLAALLRQPVAASLATLSQGRLATTFEANLADTIHARIDLNARGLVAREGNRPLGDLEASLNATMKDDSSGTLVAPIVLANGNRRSDLSIRAAFGKQPDRDAFLLTGDIASTQLFVDDFQPLAGIAPQTEAAPATRPAPPRTQPPRPTPAPPASTPARDVEPFWNAVRGKVTVDLKKVVYGKDYTIGNVRGAVTITDQRLALEGLQGLFNQNPFKASGTVTFAAQQPKPYTLTAAADVQNFDVGAFLRAAAPNEPPALEGKVTVTSNLNGNGATIVDLAKNVYGKFDVTGSEGVTRLLARKGKAGAAVNILSTGLAILGAAKDSQGTMALAKITTLLNEVPFDGFKMQVERGSDLALKVTSIEFVSPVLRATGRGAVANREGVPLDEQPMEFTFQLGSRGELAYAFNQIGLLTPNQDERGYQLLSRTFSIGGTPAKPDSSSLWAILTEAAARGLSGFLR